MTLEILFNLLNLSVMPAWALLIFAPRWSVTQALVHSMVYPIVLGLAYVAGIIASLFFGLGGEGAGFTSIAEVRAIFSSDVGVLIGWAHFLTFDLFIGAWEARDARRRGFSHWLLIPCLVFTFMFGPIGLVLYLGLRWVFRKGGGGLEEIS